MIKRDIIVDLDGTLLDRNGMLSLKTQKYIINNGYRYKFHLATGRSRANTIDIYNKLNLNSPIINFNGRSIGYANRRLKTYYMEPALLRIIYSVAMREKAYAIYYENDKFIYMLSDKKIDTPFLKKDSCIFFKGQQRILEKIVSVLIFVRKSEVEVMVNNLKSIEGIDIFKWNANKNLVCIELQQGNVSKATAITWLLEKKLVKENFIFFGDGVNDVDVFYKYSKNSIIMKNSDIKLANLKRTEHDNSNDGVIRMLDKISSYGGNIYGDKGQ